MSQNEHADMKCDESRPYVFISYCSKDYDTVKSILSELHEVYGINLWYDDEILSGEWETKAFMAMSNPNCCGIVVFVSENALISESIVKELKAAKLINKTKIVVNFNSPKRFSVQLTENIAKYNNEQVKDPKKVMTIKEMVENHLPDSFVDVPLDAREIFLAIKSDLPQMFENSSPESSTAQHMPGSADDAVPEAQADDAEIVLPLILFQDGTKRLLETDRKANRLAEAVRNLAEQIYIRLAERDLDGNIRGTINISVSRNQSRNLYFSQISIMNLGENILINTTLQGDKVSTVKVRKNGIAGEIGPEHFEQKGITRETQTIVTTILQNFGKNPA